MNLKRKRHYHTVSFIILSAALAINSSAFAQNSEIVTQTRTYDKGFEIKDGQNFTAPEGKSLTMTVNGVNTAMVPGKYDGKVALVVTNAIPVNFHDKLHHNFRTAIYINDGKFDKSSSVSQAILSGNVTDQSANDVKIDSQEERFNGIIVTGNSNYTINNPVIDLTGNGGNDFAGYGAAIMTSGKANVTLNNPKIRTKGAVRTAVFVGGYSTLTVNNADIAVENGKLPPDYKFTIEVGKMWEVPWMLGLSGNVRATNLVDHGTVYYNNSHIRAQGWGALSTDDAAVVRMYVNNSTIETLDSGYGAYSIGDSIDTFSKSTLNVADIGLIMAGPGSGVFTDGTKLISRRYGVMMHSGSGGGLLTIEKGAVFNTRQTAIEVKGRGGNVVIDNAQIFAGNGIVLQAMTNDDPFAAGAGPIVGVNGGAPPAPPGMPPPGQGVNGEKPQSPDVNVTIKNANIDGDYINTRTAQGDLNLSLDNAQITGAVSSGTQAPLTGQTPDASTFWLIGNVVNTFAPSSGGHKTNVKLSNGSVWTINKTSYLDKIEIDPSSKIAVPIGYKVSLIKDGVKQEIKSGTYAGKITLLVEANK